MTDSATLKALIADVEKAEGPDRELDARIWLASTPGATRRETRYVHKASGRENIIDETREPGGRLIVVPAYTVSLDAALTLVPEGWYGRINIGSGPEHHGDRAVLWSLDPEARESQFGVGGDFRQELLALALVTAALKARLAMMESDDG